MRFVLASLALLVACPALADDRAECLTGIEGLKSRLAARPSAGDAEDLRRTLGRAAREVGEGEFDECVEILRAGAGAGDGADDDDGPDTESLFGFTEGSDTQEYGKLEVAGEAQGALGKRVGRYRLGTIGPTFTFVPVDGLSIELGAAGSRFSVRNVPDYDNRNTGGLSGLSAEIKWRIVKRQPSSPFGVALVVEPELSFLDDSGTRGRGAGLEMKLAIDTALVPDTVFASLNLIYGAERFRPRGAVLFNGEGEELEGVPSGPCLPGDDDDAASDAETCVAYARRAPAERESRFGLSGAVAVRVAPSIFLGGELRYLRAYDGLGLDRFEGHALFAGPTLYAKLGDTLSLSAAWSAQIAGRSQETPGRSLDLDNFSRHQFRLKISHEF